MPYTPKNSCSTALTDRSSPARDPVQDGDRRATPGTARRPSQAVESERLALAREIDEVTSTLVSLSRYRAGLVRLEQRTRGPRSWARLGPDLLAAPRSLYRGLMHQKRARPAALGDDGNETRRQLGLRLRAAYVEGAERAMWRECGHGLTDDELRRVLRSYRGDLPQIDD